MSSKSLTKTATRTLIDEVDGKTTPHDEGTLSWREEAFIEMGFVAHEARALAATRIDLHHMRDLLDAGCPHDLAWQILVGTCFTGEDDYDYAPVAVAVAVAAGVADAEDDGA